jgi:hypothetical protein
MENKKQRLKRPAFTPELKAEAVRLCRAIGPSRRSLATWI